MMWATGLREGCSDARPRWGAGVSSQGGPKALASENTVTCSELIQGVCGVDASRLFPSLPGWQGGSGLGVEAAPQPRPFPAPGAWPALSVSGRPALACSLSQVPPLPGVACFGSQTLLSQKAEMTRHCTNQLLSCKINAQLPKNQRGKAKG